MSMPLEARKDISKVPFLLLYDPRILKNISRPSLPILGLGLSLA